MKKIKLFAIAFITMLLLPLSVFASGSISPSPRSITITKGGTASFTVSASNAVGRVDISSSNSSVATVNKSSEWLENNSVTVTVTGVSAGTTTINVKLSDAATFDEEELSGNYTVTVTVVEPNNNGSNNNGNNKPNNNNSNNSNRNDNLSKNNSIGSLEIEGYDLKKIDDNNYELSVSNNVSSIIINGKSADKKAKIEGLGEKQLKIGENTFEIVVTAENGSKNKILIKVTRKDGYYLDDLNNILNDATIKEAQIIVNNDGKITKDDLNSIKDSKKTISLDFYDSDKNLLYSWIIDGNKLGNINDFNTNISFKSEAIKNIGKLSNYADGKYFHFEQNGNIPKGIKIKLYVGDKFDNNSLVNVYYYNENTLDLIKNDLKVDNGYIEFDIEHCSEYFVTMATITSSASKTNTFIIISIVELVLLITLVILDYFKVNPLYKFNKKK